MVVLLYADVQDGYMLVEEAEDDSNYNSDYNSSDEASF